MDTDDTNGVRPREEGSALERTLLVYLRSTAMWTMVAALFIGSAIVVDSVLEMDGASVVIIVPTLVISVLAAVISLLVFPASVWEEHVEGKREAKRHAFEEAAAKLGAPAPEEVSLTPREKLARVLHDSRRPLVATAVLEVVVALPFVTHPEVLRAADGGFDTFMTAVMLAMVTPIPLYTAFSLLVDAFSDDTSSAADARAERAYREAVKDREQLAGGLVLDEHVSSHAGGELTVQRQVGALEIHEQVALDLEGVAASDEDARVGAVASHVAQG